MTGQTPLTMPKKTSFSPTRRMDLLTAYCMILPSLILLGIFVIWPLASSILHSFTDWNFYHAENVGMLNYVRVFKNPIFKRSLENTLVYILYAVPLSIVVPFLLAHCVKALGEGLYAAGIKTVLYVPSIISGVISSVIFLFILDYQGGVINNLIRSLGGQRINFLADGNMAKWSIVLTGFWTGAGYSTLYQLAGLNNIPETFYEAAKLDGASAFKRMVYITIPGMKNILMLSLVNGVSGTLMMMELPLLMTKGGPNNATITPVLYIYNMFNDSAQSMGYVLACSIVMLLFGSILTGASFFLFKPDKSME